MGNSNKKASKDKQDGVCTARKPSYVIPEELLKEVSEISEGLLEEFRYAFKVFDKDNSHFIDASELKHILFSIGQTPTDKDIEAMIEIADIDQSGTIDFEEFVLMMLWYSKNTNPEEELRQAFRVFDKDSDGFVSCKELKEKMKTLGEKMTEEEAEEMMRDADINGDGIIDCDKFIELLCMPKDLEKSISKALRDG